MKKTIIDLFESSVTKYGDKDFLLEKHDGKFCPTSYNESKALAMKIGAGLVAMGVKPKQTISILAEGCNNWILSELGLLYAGAISVPLSIKLEEANDLLFRLRHADVETIFVSQYQLPKIRKIREQLPLIKTVIIFDGVKELQEGEILLSDVMQKGEEYLKDNEAEFLKIGQAIQNDDYATITYTSGTTADPKGVILTHRNYTANVEQALTRISIPPTYRTLIILPLDHCFAHVCGFYIMIACGAAVATTQVGRTPMETLKNIPLNIKEVKPHFLLSVPALAKNFRKSIETSIRKQGPKVEKLFNFALKVSYEYNQDGFSKGKGWRFVLKPLVALFDKILFKKVREGFGGELQFFVGGGALLDAELQRFFYAVGMPMYQGYGLSEATPIISTNSIGAGNHRFGSSGKLIEPLDIKILDDEGKEMPCGVKGEIVIKGENV
ncbi:MAG: AMP-binding protein, partial [Alistipes sp.]|nr:AMP-binding protein [Alistipes sp.]